MVIQGLDHAILTVVKHGGMESFFDAYCSKGSSLSRINMRQSVYSCAYARSLLRRNQAQTAKEASREKISAVPAILVAKKNYSTTLVDDHCSASIEAPGHCGGPIKMICRSFAISTSI